MNETDIDYTATMAGETDFDCTATLAGEIDTLCKQVQAMYVVLDSYTGLSPSEDWNSHTIDLKAHLDTMKETVSKLQDSSLYNQQMENLKSPEDISFHRENPGRRKKPSGDSGLGSSSFGSVVSFRCPTCSRHSGVTLPSNLIPNIPESSDEKVEKFILANDFITPTVIQEYEPEGKKTKSENDLSKPTAEEHTESSESDNEKQPVYSSDESRLSSMNSISLVNKETQTVLCASNPRMSNLSHVTATFYELECDGDHCEDRVVFNGNENRTILVNNEQAVLELNAGTEDVSET